MNLLLNNKPAYEEVFDTVSEAVFVIEPDNKFNYLIHAENLSALKTLLKTHKESIDLIYIDPPYSTNNIFKIGNDGRANTISSAFSDDIAYEDNLKGSDYLEFLRERLLFAKELLSKKGSIYLHIDYKIGHYVKILMDEIFGIENFRNDITRIKCNPKNFERSAYGNIKDMILFYSKSNKPLWNNPKTDYTKDDIEKLFKKTDKNGRRYTTIPLHAPGETKNGATSFEFKGIKPPKGRHWRTSPSELEKLDEMGLIEWSKTGVPRKIIYADEQQGKKMQDIWEFKDPQYPDYPTEKNLDLLKTIIEASSDKDSIVLDFFCGSGTALVAANILKRKWIGIDISKKAIDIAKNRIQKESVDLFSAPFKVIETKENELCKEAG